MYHNLFEVSEAKDKYIYIFNMPCIQHFHPKNMQNTAHSLEVDTMLQ
jgi:hypothetical protein